MSLYSITSLESSTLSLPIVSSPIVWKRSPSGENNLIDLVAESVTIMLPASSTQNEVGFHFVSITKQTNKTNNKYTQLQLYLPSLLSEYSFQNC